MINEHLMKFKQKSRQRLIFLRVHNKVTLIDTANLALMHKISTGIVYKA